MACFRKRAPADLRRGQKSGPRSPAGSTSSHLVMFTRVTFACGCGAVESIPALEMAAFTSMAVFGDGC
eukprot:1323612-Prymnesium_polylepis.2